ncbi:CoA synthetase [Frigidibacter albus]|uniref:CoA synthetase n=1 Tax=Frigidibacter albus TaxID=1465486 RepID=A0A6L8VBK2_9RHOB|nr:CoA-transferase [Frigidibacter albus]MZQ87688.1 CoA synthetase [Frigidibacter albus]NBE29594.1 CoA synthetase [Frigidibacter albus]GGH43931.1 CoA synthetase [Frigidibacter albus]
MTGVLPRETLIFTIARLLEGVRLVAVGAASPIPAAGSMLRRALDEGQRQVRLSVLGSVEHNFFTNGSAELFDSAGQGRLDAFFLGGGQIDGQANVNLVGAGDYPQSSVRWPGSFGSAYLYFTVPRVILFREEHSRRVLVEKVDFISAPGTSPKGVYRPGGPVALLTSKGLFTFDKTRPGFTLDSVHPGHTPAEIAEATGFAYDAPAATPNTPQPGPATLSLLRGRVLTELAETYPAFAADWRRDLAALAA